MLRIRPLPVGITGREAFYLLATWGHSGRLTPASGTWGSLAALPVCLGVQMVGGNIMLGLFALACLAAGCWAVRVFQRRTQRHDPSEIVIDEVIGMALTFLFVPCGHVGFSVLAFCLFRFFDALKVGFVGWCDRRIGGAAGVIIDDIAAGLLAGAGVLVLAAFFA